MTIAPTAPTDLLRGRARLAEVCTQLNGINALVALAPGLAELNTHRLARPVAYLAIDSCGAGLLAVGLDSNGGYLDSALLEADGPLAFAPCDTVDLNGQEVIPVDRVADLDTEDLLAQRLAPLLAPF